MGLIRGLFNAVGAVVAVGIMLAVGIIATVISMSLGTIALGGFILVLLWVVIQEYREKDSDSIE